VVEPRSLEEADESGVGQPATRNIRQPLEAGGVGFFDSASGITVSTPVTMGLLVVIRAKFIL